MATFDYPLVIAFTGDIGCGKSTAASILKEYGFHESLFAGPLKKFSRSIGFTENEIYGTQAEKLAINKQLGISGREFMQKFGSEVCRDALPKIIPDMKLGNNTLWVKVMDNYIKKQSPDAKIVISDARFKDEFDLVRIQHGGIVIRITRPIQKEESNATMHQSELLMHQSELLMKSLEVDFNIINDGSIDELKNKIINIINTKYSIQLSPSNLSSRVPSLSNAVLSFGMVPSGVPSLSNAISSSPVVTKSNLSIQCKMINRIFPLTFKQINLYNGSCKKCYLNCICKDCCDHHHSYASRIFRVLRRNIFGNINHANCNNIYFPLPYRIAYSFNIWGWGLFNGCIIASMFIIYGITHNIILLPPLSTGPTIASINERTRQIIEGRLYLSSFPMNHS